MHNSDFFSELIGQFESLPTIKDIPLEIKVHYKEGAHPLKQIDKGGCIDFYNYNDLDLKAGHFAMIDTGVAIGIPDGYDLLIFPRSSTFKRYGLIETNSVGYVDNSFRGSDDFIHIPVLATKDIFIPKGTRCFQFRLINMQPVLNFEAVDKLEYENRKGFGSSGI